MRLLSIVSESLRNIGAGTSRAFLWCLVTMLVGVLLGGVDAVTIIGEEREAAARIDANADVRVLVAPTAVVDGATCDLITGAAGGPDATGALRPGPQITMRATPGRDVSSYEVTPGFLRLLAAGSATADATGVWVSAELARNFGLSKGARLETTAGDATVAGVYDWPNDGRDTRLAYAMVVPVSASASPFVECWAKQWPVSGRIDELLNEAVIANGSSGASAGSSAGASGVAGASDASMRMPAGIAPLNRSFDSRYDANARYRSRLTRHAPFAALVAGMLIGIIGVHRRRLEYAGALHSGQRKADQMLGVAIETAIWGGLGTLSALAVLTAACVRMSPSDPDAVLFAAARVPIALLAGMMIGSLLMVATVRESRLFRYFKKR